MLNVTPDSLKVCVVVGWVGERNVNEEYLRRIRCLCILPWQAAVKEGDTIPKPHLQHLSPMLILAIHFNVPLLTGVVNWAKEPSSTINTFFSGANIYKKKLIAKLFADFFHSSTHFLRTPFLKAIKLYFYKRKLQ